MSVGVVCNFHREPHALRGFVEMAAKTFDNCVFVSSPPDGTPHCEESIEIVKKSGCKLIHDTVSQGFGALRTRCIGYSKCDWTMIMDADERIFDHFQSMSCEGDEFYPQNRNPSLILTQNKAICDQRRAIRSLITQADSEGALAVCLSRRHWLTSPDEKLENWKSAQSWSKIPDWQLRLVKNSPFAFYDPEVKMHERLLNAATWSEPKYIRSQSTDGPFIDHFSIYFKSLDPKKNKEDANPYEGLEKGSVDKMWLSTFEGAKP